MPVIIITIFFLLRQFNVSLVFTLSSASFWNVQCIQNKTLVSITTFLDFVYTGLVHLEFDGPTS